jgi:hypothetical protein
MFLIEKFTAETPKDVQSFLEALVGEIYGKRPEWLDYKLRDCYRFKDREFVRMDCPAGSVHAQLSLRASSGEGITRDILELGTREGRSCAWLLHQGKQSEFDSHEVERIG